MEARIPDGRSRRRRWPGGVLLATLVLAAGLAAAEPPFPFSTDEEALAFLREAEVLSWEEIAVGITGPRKAHLERDGLCHPAIFRTVFEQKKVVPWDFLDSYISEVAAFELARLLGLDTVPPVVLRRFGLRRGSLQIWVEGAMTEADRLRGGIEPPDPEGFERQLQVMRLFDNLVANLDRNPGNLLVDASWKVWFIDHTRSFGKMDVLPHPDALGGAPRPLWERLRSLTEGEIRERLRRHVGRVELRALLKRRELLVEALEERMRAEGEDAVLW